MTRDKAALRYEDAAHKVIRVGWACKRCDRFHGDNEHLARWCCASDLPCRECGGRNTNKAYTCCQACKRAKDARRDA